MIYGVQPWALAIAGGVLLSLVTVVVGFWLGAKNAADSGVLEPLDDIEGGEGFRMYDTGSDGLVSTYLSERKKSDALEDGYVRWHLVDSAFSTPMYVKPERKAGNVPEVKRDGNTYLFPRSAMVPSAEEGVPTVVHREGESDPIDLRDDWDLALDSKTLTQYLETSVTSDKPGGLGLGLGNMGSMELLRYGILAIVGLFVLSQLAGGI